MEQPPEPAAGSPAPPSFTSEPVDLGLTPHSLQRAVYSRRAEYTYPHRIRVKIGTWNVAACADTDQDLALWFFSDKCTSQDLESISQTANGDIKHETPTDSSEDAPKDVHLIGGDKIGLYALGLQEVVDLNTATQYIGRASAASVLEKWKTAADSALAAGYELVASEQMAGLLLLVYASPDVVPMISHTDTSAVGTGLLGMLGNKGAVSARLVLGESSKVVFINSHLSSGNDTYYMDRRCWDVAQIQSRTQFSPVNQPGVTESTEPEKIGEEDVAFWFGDLNFRLDDLPGEDIRRILTLHVRGEYNLSHRPYTTDSTASLHDGEDTIIPRDRNSGDAPPSQTSTLPIFLKSSVTDTKQTDSDWSVDHVKELPLLPDPDDFSPDASEDPVSLQATLGSLLPHDQLKRAIKERKALYDGWREGRITFLPSYKYDVGSVGLFDSSDKRRPPSWCDRILYRTGKDKESYERRAKEEEETRKKDEEMKARGLDRAGDEDEVLFEYHVSHDGEDPAIEANEPSSFEYDEYDEANDEAETEPVADKDGDIDSIQLEIYTSHQQITSSDHKPVVAVFTVDFDAVVPKLKAKVHAEVAKEFDRAENEGRPGVTVIVDGRASSAMDDAVEFESVEFLRRSSALLTIANTGRVPAEFSFIEKPSNDDLGSRSSGDGDTSYRWLTTFFVQQGDGNENGVGLVDLGKSITLEPGETVNAVLEVLVDDFVFARILNDGDGLLEDVLVLRIVDGRDHFIPVRGVWSPTCIGRSVEELVRVPDGGIRSFVLSRLQAGGRGGVASSIPYNLDVHRSAPKELLKLTEQIENLADRVAADEQMLEEFKIPANNPGWPFERPTRPPDPELIVAVIEALDNDRPVLNAFQPETSSLARLEVVSHVLLLFLQGLTDGVITISLWSHIYQAPLLSLGSTRNTNPGGRDPVYETDKTTILDILSAAPYHNICFVFLTTALSRVIGELAPLSLSDLDVLRAISRTSSVGFGAAMGGISNIGRRSLKSFRRTGAATASAALEALDRRQAREKRVAEIFGKLVCRTPALTKEKDRKTVEDRQRAIVELFLRRSREELG